MDIIQKIEQLNSIDNFIMVSLIKEETYRLDEMIHDLVWSIAIVFLNSDEEFTLPAILQIL
jgi:hypothetical protein